MTTTDIITLIAPAAFFAVFTATMTWVEVLRRRHTEVRVCVYASRRRGRHPF